MIKGFEYETAPLTPEERSKLVPYLVSFLSQRKGQRMAVTSKDMQRATGEKLCPPRCRKIINYIRNNDLVPGLIATSNGYFVAQSIEELKDYEESLKGREEAIRSVRESIARQRRMFYEDAQRELPLFDQNNG